MNKPKKNDPNACFDCKRRFEPGEERMKCGRISLCASCDRSRTVFVDAVSVIAGAMSRERFDELHGDES